MARIRTIKPDFWTDEKLTECSMSARLLFIGMFNFADDNGNLSASAKKLKMQIFPADNIDCQPLLNELIGQGVIIEYSVSGDNYLNIKGFKKHQVINRPSKSNIPQMAINEQSDSTHGLLSEPSLMEGKGRERKGITKETTAAAANTSTTVAPVDNSPPVPELVEKPKKPLPDGPARFAVLIRKWERDRGKASKTTSSDPRLMIWHEKGVTEAQLREAYDLAVADRDLVQDPTAINAGFLDTMLAKVLAPPTADSALNRATAPASAKPWQASWSGIETKGEELGLTQQEDEQPHQFKARVFAAADMTEEEKSRLRSDWGVMV